MRATRIFFCFVWALLACLGVTSCGEQDLFNKDLYRYYVRTNYPVDTLEADHPWTLLSRYSLSVFADVSDNSISEVRIFTAHPQDNASAVMVAQADISKGGRATLTFDVAQTQGTMYAVLVARSGKYYVLPFSPTQASISFSSADTREYTSLPEPKLQTFTYLFETSFPTAEDFDYNDVVLRITREVPQQNILQLRVTLAAVGCYKKVAGAIRLPGISYEDVDHVEIEEGKAFVEDYPQMLTKLDVNGPLGRARNGEAVICLFEDAHYALNNTPDESDVIAYIPYNTDLFPDGETAANVDEQTRTYNIFLKVGVNVQGLLLADLDPFVIEDYSQINFEVHTYKYKFSEVMWEYLGDDKQAYDDYLAWALAIPSGTFRYPIEKVPLGTYHNGELYGAYGQKGHSFGEWGRNYRMALDWWLHPNSALVF